MSKSYLIPEILLVLLVAGIAFIAGVSITKEQNETVQVNSKVSNLVDKSIKKMDSYVQKIIDMIVEKLPDKAVDFGKNLLKKGWNKLKQSFLNKIGAS